MPTPEGINIAAARPKPAQHPMIPSPVFIAEVAIDMEAKSRIPTRKTGLLPKASAIDPITSSKAPLTSENMDRGHESNSCERLTDFAIDGRAW